MATLVSWSGNGLSPGPAVTNTTAGTGDNAPGSVQGTAPTLEASGFHPVRIRFPAAVTSYLVWGHAGFSAGAYRWYTNLSNTATGQRIALGWTGAAVAWQLDVNGSGKLVLSDSTGALATSVPSVPLNTELRFEVVYNAGAITANVYVGQSTSALISINGGVTSSTITEFWWGSTFGASHGTWAGDDLRIDNTAALIGRLLASGSDGSTLTQNLNRLAGTQNLDAQGAANVWAGTTGLSLSGALNVKAVTTGLEVQGVLNVLAGTTGLGPDGASSRILG